jgi:RNA polymerase sigma factor (sigma-70 family)
MSPSVSVRLLLTQSDSRLVAHARAGHERAFEALVQRYRRPLLGYCRRLLLSEERAEDALQQALLQAWLALRSGTEVANVKPWLFRIVHNAALNALRVSGYDYCKLSESLSGLDAPQEDLDRRIAVREALAGLAALPQMQREALMRTAVEGASHQQVARDMGLSENALRGLVYRARATLRAAAGAILPPPLVSWALGSGGRGAPVIERLAELGAGGGSASVTGLLMKGGAVAVTASVMAGGIAAVHPYPKRPPGQWTSRSTARLAHAGRTSLLAAKAPSASLAPTPSGTQRHTIHPRHATRQARIDPQDAMSFTTRTTQPPSPIWTGEHDRRAHGDANRAGGPDSSAPPSNSTATKDGKDGHNAVQPGRSSGEDGSSTRETAGEGSSGKGTDGSSSESGSGDTSTATGGGRESTDDGRQEDPHDIGGSSEARSSTTTSSSSKDEQSESPEQANGS